MALFKIQRGLSKNFAYDINPEIYSSEKVYELNDLCFYSGLIYRCIVAITIPEEFNSEHWYQLNNSPVFTDGFAYFTPDDAGFYIDATYQDPNTGLDVNRRIKVNSWHNVNLTGIATAPTILKEDGTIDIDDSSNRIATTAWVNELINSIIDESAQIDGNKLKFNYVFDTLQTGNSLEVF